MAPGGRRDSPGSEDDRLDGRDLLVGRPEGAEGRSVAGAAGAAPATTSPQPGAHDDAIREILETVRATAARIDALQEAPGPEHEMAEALARETAALTRAVEDARGALAEAAEVAAQQDGQATAGAQALAKSVAALKAQGEALDKRIRATGTQTQANARQVKETAGQAEAPAAAVEAWLEQAGLNPGQRTTARRADQEGKRPERRHLRPRQPRQQRLVAPVEERHTSVKAPLFVLGQGQDSHSADLGLCARRSALRRPGSAGGAIPLLPRPFGRSPGRASSELHRDPAGRRLRRLPAALRARPIAGARHGSALLGTRATQVL